MIVRELKMTKICDVCQNQYGLWRHRCDACGTENKDREAACAAPAPQTKRGGATLRERVRAKNSCIFCYGRKAKDKCPHCEEPIHRNCRGLHEQSCAAFQVERKAAEARLEGKNEASPVSVLSSPQSPRSHGVAHPSR